jgi:hypothetical protein
MAVECKVCGNPAIYSVPTTTKGVSNYCAKDIPAVRKADANKGRYPLIKPKPEVVAPAKKAPKATKEEPVVEEAPVEEVATLEEIAVESTDEDN